MVEHRYVAEKGNGGLKQSTGETGLDFSVVWEHYA